MKSTKSMQKKTFQQLPFRIEGRIKSCMRTWLKTVSKNARGLQLWKVKTASGPLLFLLHQLHRGPLSAWEREPPKISSDAKTKASGQLSKPKTESWEVLKNNNWQLGEKVDLETCCLGELGTRSGHWPPSVASHWHTALVAEVTKLIIGQTLDRCVTGQSQSQLVVNSRLCPLWTGSHC